MASRISHRRHVANAGLSVGRPARLPAGQTITKVALAFNRVVAQALTQFPPQLAHMALNRPLGRLLVEHPVDSPIELLARQPPAAMGIEHLEYPPLTPGQLEPLAEYFGIPAIGMDIDVV